MSVVLHHKMQLWSPKVKKYNFLHFIEGNVFYIGDKGKFPKISNQLISLLLHKILNASANILVVDFHYKLIELSQYERKSSYLLPFLLWRGCTNFHNTLYYYFTILGTVYRGKDYMRFTFIAKLLFGKIFSCTVKRGARYTETRYIEVRLQYSSIEFFHKVKN